MGPYMSALAHARCVLGSSRTLANVDSRMLSPCPLPAAALAESGARSVVPSLWPMSMITKTKTINRLAVFNPEWHTITLGPRWAAQFSARPVSFSGLGGVDSDGSLGLISFWLDKIHWARRGDEFEAL